MPSSEKRAAPISSPASPSSTTTYGPRMNSQSTSQASQLNPRGTIMLTRRRFLVLFPAFAVPAIAAPAQSLPFKTKRPLAPPAPLFVYFGTDTQKGGSKGIYQSRFDPKTGQLTTPIPAAATARPSFLGVGSEVDEDRS